MNKLFKRFLKSRTHGNPDNELYWWDIFYRYEVGIGAALGVIPCLIAAVIIIPILCFSHPASEAFANVMFSIGVAMMIGLAAAWIIVSPLKETVGDKTVRKEDLGQGSLLFASGLGHIVNLFVNWGPILIFCLNLASFKWSRLILLAIVIIGYYMLLGIVKANAKDYVNWRFSWAIENYETLYSGHYKWWTSVNDMSVQKIHLKKFQNYKYHAALAIIMIPLLMTPLIAMFASDGPSKKIKQEQVTTDSISTPDVVENTTVDDESNVEAEQYESVEPDEFMSSDENVSDESRYNEYEEYEERSSQAMAYSNNSVSPQTETKPKTEAVTRTNDQANTASTAPREERQAVAQAEQTPKENAGPEFQGGNYALSSYIARHINYPPAAAEKKIQGKVVVKLTISSTGQVSNAEIVQSVDEMLDAEALRLCKALPRFTPARRNGQPVASTMTIPINFRL